MKWLGDIFSLDFGKIFKEAIGAVGDVGSKVLGWLGWGGDKEAESKGHGGGLVTKGGSVSVAAGEVIANAQQGRQLTQLMQEKQGLEGQGRGPVIINNTSNRHKSDFVPFSQYNSRVGSERSYKDSYNFPINFQ